MHFLVSHVFLDESKAKGIKRHSQCTEPPVVNIMHLGIGFGSQHFLAPVILLQVSTSLFQSLQLPSLEKNPVSLSLLPIRTCLPPSFNLLCAFKMTDVIHKLGPLGWFIY